MSFGRTCLQLLISVLVIPVSIGICLFTTVAAADDNSHWDVAIGDPGLNDEVESLVVSGDYLYVGGKFSKAGGAAALHMAKWNISTGEWSQVGGGLYHSTYTTHVFDLAVTPDGRYLYAVGQFNKAGGKDGIDVNNFARYDLVADKWETFTGTNTQQTGDYLLSVAANSSGVYVGGFGNHGIWNRDTEPAQLGRGPVYWEGHSTTGDWAPLGGGVDGNTNNPNVNALAFAPNGDLIVGGGFDCGHTHWPLTYYDSNEACGDSASSITLNYLARWRDGAWTSLGGGFQKAVTAVAVSGNKIIVGSAKCAQIKSAEYSATGELSWSTIGAGLGSCDEEGADDEIIALAAVNSKIFAAGTFSPETNGAPASEIAVYDATSGWQELGTSFRDPTYGIQCLSCGVQALEGDGRYLYVGGAYWHYVGGQSSDGNIARWDTGEPTPTPVPTPTPGGSEVSYSLWNGFLNMTCILELVNNGTSAMTVRGYLYKIDGTLGSYVDIPLAASQQYDLILNDMSGFQADSYGIFKLEYDGDLDGRITYYRSSSAGIGYDFVFGVPLTEPSQGDTAVGFNTFQPSSDPLEAGNLVTNWLSIVNLAEEAKNFTINKYNQIGELLTSSAVPVPGFGRVDVDGGHQNPGPMNVGLNVILPQDSTAPYIAQLMRYGSDSLGGYNFAFPLLAKAGPTDATHVPISNNLNAQNWLEVINIKDEACLVDINCYNSSGVLLQTWEIGIGAYSQEHLNVSALLGADESGVCSLSKVGTAGDVLAQSMFYFRDTTSGGMLAMYGSQSREASGKSLYGSYNLFLGMENILRLFNPTSTDVPLVVTVYHQVPPVTKSVTLPANGLLDLELHDTAQYGTEPDSYGVVTVEGSVSGSTMAEMLRTRITPGTAVLDFRIPTEVR